MRFSKDRDFTPYSIQQLFTVLDYFLSVKKCLIDAYLQFYMVFWDKVYTSSCQLALCMDAQKWIGVEVQPVRFGFAGEPHRAFQNGSSGSSRDQPIPWLPGTTWEIARVPQRKYMSLEYWWHLLWTSVERRTDTQGWARCPQKSLKVIIFEVNWSFYVVN